MNAITSTWHAGERAAQTRAGTAEHMAALQEHGACPQHRKTFAPVSRVLR